MSVLLFIIALLAGAFVGKFIAILTEHLPKFLLDDKQELNELNIYKLYWQSSKGSWRARLPILDWGSLVKRGLIIEWGTALFFALATLFIAPGEVLVLVLLATALLICCFITDIEYGILPDQFTLTLVWLGLIASLNNYFLSPEQAIIGAAAGYGVFRGFNDLFKLLRGHDGMYAGDFKLNAAIGAFVGFESLMTIFLLSSVLLVIGTATQKLLVEKKIDKTILNVEAPYGCYAAFVTICALFMRAI